MNKVIPQVGQVWTCQVIGGDVDREISAITDRDEFWDVIHFKCGNHMSQADIGKGIMTFKPANVSEWLAVNIASTCLDERHYYRMKGCDDYEIFLGHENGSISGLKIIDKRNELFGEKVMAPAKKMKVEYEHVYGLSFWEVAKEYVNIEFFYKDDSKTVHQVHTIEDLIACFKAANLYRRIETEVTWQDELEEFLNKKRFDGATLNKLEIDELENPFGCVDMDMGLRFGDFEDMCRLVVRHVGMTDKPE